MALENQLIYSYKKGETPASQRRDLNNRLRKDIGPHELDAILDVAGAEGADDCISALKNGLERRGFAFSAGKRGEEEAYNLAREMYAAVPRRDVFAFSPKDGTDIKFGFGGGLDIPSLTLDFGHRRYYLHGISHFLLSRELKDFMVEKCYEYDDPEQKKYLFYEEGLDSYLRLPLEIGLDLRDHLPLSAPAALYLMLKGIVLSPVSFCHTIKQKFKNGTGAQDSGVDLKTFSQVEHAMRKDITYMPRYMKLLMTGELPEPFNLAGERGAQKYLGRGRSELMARKMFESDGEEIHLLCGDGHLSQVAYFLMEFERKRTGGQPETPSRPMLLKDTLKEHLRSVYLAASFPVFAFGTSFLTPPLMSADNFFYIASMSILGGALSVRAAKRISAAYKTKLARAGYDDKHPDS